MHLLRPRRQRFSPKYVKRKQSRENYCCASSSPRASFSNLAAYLGRAPPEAAPDPLHAIVPPSDVTESCFPLMDPVRCVCFKRRYNSLDCGVFSPQLVAACSSPQIEGTTEQRKGEQSGLVDPAPCAKARELRRLLC